MKGPKVLTVTVGIPAHNEESNIGKLLQTIVSQKQSGYRLDKVIVVCDGCTDKTAAVVSDFSKKFKFIKLIDDGKRLGQSGRLNYFYKNSRSDIFVTFDADVTPVNKNVISELVKPFADKKVGLVGGLNIPLSRKTFVEKIVTTYEFFWAETIQKVNHGDNVHNNPGCISAARRELIKKVRLPENIVANDHFIYFKALEQGYKFKFSKKALVYFKVPANFHDYMLQSTRFISSAGNIERYFGDWVNDLYKIPVKIKLAAYLKTFIKEPIFLPLALLLQIVRKILTGKFLEASYNGVWTSVRSSK